MASHPKIDASQMWAPSSGMQNDKLVVHCKVYIYGSLTGTSASFDGLFLSRGGITAPGRALTPCSFAFCHTTCVCRVTNSRDDIRGWSVLSASKTFR